MQSGPRSDAPAPMNVVPLEHLRPIWSAGLVLALVLLPLLPVARRHDLELNFLTGMLIWGLLALSLDLVWGYGA